ncbi:PREDICTED: uncharacterized protein LOC108506486 isoform X2 [Lepidothrix coronata]|uniref:Uncharacterized protein LOC108506486 isoform X2 n=1 Tax=Lepidothrix coronata TaxID=321398 RepID=A0A6J0ISL0_9PASS|nr:PREDICTED: uncharacterized protein LOC108506486 isoform X2 [Lepidothrix coronata]
MQVPSCARRAWRQSAERATPSPMWRLESLGRASSLHGDGLPALPGQQSLQGTGSHPTIVPSKTKPAQGLEISHQARPKLRVSWSKTTLPWQQHCLEEEELPEQTGHDHLACLPWFDGRAGQVNFISVVEYSNLINLLPGLQNCMDCCLQIQAKGRSKKPPVKA